MFAYLIVTGALLLLRQQSLAEINSDGFNIYKGRIMVLLKDFSFFGFRLLADEIGGTVFHL